MPWWVGDYVAGQPTSREEIRTKSRNRLANSSRVDDYWEWTKMSRTCFVIMPFSGTTSCTAEQWTEVFEEIISPAVRQSRLAFTCTRSQIRTGAFIKDILLELNRADVVIADLTDRNPNVFYELGVRHTLKNSTVLIAQHIEDIPSDLKSYGVIVYERTPTGIAKFKREMRRLLSAIVADPDRSDNPVGDYLKAKDIALLQYERVQSGRKLAALISELSFNLAATSKIAELVDKQLDGDNKEKSYTLLSYRTGALEELLATNYIAVPEDALTKLHQLLEVLVLTNNQTDVWRQGRPDLKGLQNNVKVCERWLERAFKMSASFRSRLLTSTALEAVLPVVVLGDEKHRQLLD
ncbi:MAG: hypothetical protein ACYC5Y_05340 [Symbiobacteriia bacterium]